MKTKKLLSLTLSTVLALGLFTSPGYAETTNQFNLATTYTMSGGVAEIVASTPNGKTLVVTEGSNGSISIISVGKDADVSVQKQVSFKELSSLAEVTSVAISPNGKYALVTVRTGDDLNNANKGFVAVVDIKEGKTVQNYPVGIGPDAIALSPDGKTAVISNEDEEGDPANDNEIDFSKVKRPGTISVIKFKGGDYLQGEHTEIKLDLSRTGNHVTYPQDPQPEYVSISPDGTMAAVTLQENNAIAVIDLDRVQIKNTFGLGLTKHKADLKNDGKVSITQDMVARPEADGVVWSPDGRYLITANEGDLGKNEFKDGIKSGGRNIMVWDLDGKVVYDSMHLIDSVLAEAGLYPDSRSDRRGSEVENLTVGSIDDNPVLAVASERGNAVLFFDITDVTKPELIQVVAAGGKGPEGISQVGDRDMFVTADEATGTLSFYKYGQDKKLENDKPEKN